jgi:hypothetical protein
MFTCLQNAEVTPYDLVIFDEAHKLSADCEADLSMRRTDVAEALGSISSDAERWSLSWNCQHILLLTATPHMGKEFPYYCLWRLLEPEAFSTLDAFRVYPLGARQRHFIRRVKEEHVSFESKLLYPPCIPDMLSYDLTKGEEGEQELYDATTQYIATTYNRARLFNRSAARLAERLPASAGRNAGAEQPWALATGTIFLDENGARVLPRRNATSSISRIDGVAVTGRLCMVSRQCIFALIPIPSGLRRRSLAWPPNAEATTGWSVSSRVVRRAEKGTTSGSRSTHMCCGQQRF